MTQAPPPLSKDPFQALLGQAIALHNRGELAGAEQLYKQILRANPNHVIALNRIGSIAAAAGHLDHAARFIGRAAQLAPDNAEVINNLGLVHLTGQSHEQALACFQRAVALDPTRADAWNNLGVVQGRMERNDAAVDAFRQALACNPSHASAWLNLGLHLGKAGQSAEAVDCFEKLIQLQPDDARAWRNLGAAQIQLEAFEKAVPALRRAVELDPADIDSIDHCGGALVSLRKYAEALDCYRRVLQARPESSVAHVNVANAFLGLHRHGEAIMHYQQAVALDPKSVMGHLRCGELLGKTKNIRLAVQHLEAAYAVDPNWEWLEGRLLMTRAIVCDWNEREQRLQSALSHVTASMRTLMPFEAACLLSRREDLYLCARSYVAAELPPVPALPQQAPKPRSDKIRIGYVSADLHNHATAFLMAELFECHDRSQFEVVAFSIGPASQDEMRLRLHAAFDAFHDMRELSDREVAQRIADAGIDILVDLKGFTEHARFGIFMHRPAPIQVSYLGFPGTTGADCMDYVIGDATVTPFEHQPWYSERIVQMPHSYQVNDRKRRVADQVPTRAESGLPLTGFVFCCFNNNYKITPAVFDIWMRLLHQVPGSVLWLLKDNELAGTNLLREAAQRGVAPERLVFAKRLPLAEHLARHRLADLFLDTLPCNAHTTASDALWVGLPVLTCLGETFASRVGASLLRAVGLPEMVVDNLADYEARALALAKDPEALAQLRARLLAQRDTAPLFDTDRFRRDLESAYQTMWQRHQQGLPPAPFAVPASPSGH